MDLRWTEGSTNAAEDCRRREPISSQAEPTHWHALLGRVELGVAEINGNLEMVARSLGGKGLTLRVGDDSLEVARAAPPLMRLLVTNRGQSVSAEWETETGGGQEVDCNWRERKVPLKFDTDPRAGLILRKESGASMVLDEAVRYLLTPLLLPRT